MNHYPTPAVFCLVLLELPPVSVATFDHELLLLPLLLVVLSSIVLHTIASIPPMPPFRFGVELRKPQDPCPLSLLTIPARCNFHRLLHLPVYP